MKKICLFILTFGFVFAEYEYSLQDYNPTSESYGLDIWDPLYSDYMTLHFFSSQGWAGWTSTFGQLSNFQEELREDDGYENVVIIAVGQTNISNFNNNFCSNSDLPLVMDSYPSLPIRAQFSPYGTHKSIVILDYDGSYLGSMNANSVTNSLKNYIRGILEEHYEQSILGDVNGDTTVNIQDVILLVNMILNGPLDDSADINADGTVNILDVIQIVNIILN